MKTQTRRMDCCTWDMEHFKRIDEEMDGKDT